LPSDDLFPETKGPQTQWEGLEKRINRLLEGIVQLRGANGQLMKENVLLKNQLKDAGTGSNGSSEEVDRLKRQYEEAVRDLRQVKQNLQRLESLAAELKLEDQRP
jgi:chromosome segregation ATPase